MREVSLPRYKVQGIKKGREASNEHEHAKTLNDDERHFARTSQSGDYHIVLFVYFFYSHGKGIVFFSTIVKYNCTVVTYIEGRP
jgi:hypothetical protein